MESQSPIWGTIWGTNRGTTSGTRSGLAQSSDAPTMSVRTAHIPYIERRAGGFLFRRRLPSHFLKVPESVQKTGLTKRFLRLSLRTHVAWEARDIGARITALTDLAFGLMTECDMDHLRPDQIGMLEALARFQIAAHAALRAAAPARSYGAAEHAAACERATQTVLQQALATGNREMAREPLRHVAMQLGVSLEEDTEDWNRLAYEATRVLLDVSRDRERREMGLLEEPSPVFVSARRTPGAAHHPVARNVAIPMVAPMAPVALPTPAVHPAATGVQDAPPVAAPSNQNNEPAMHLPTTPTTAPQTETPPNFRNIPFRRLKPETQELLRSNPRGLTITKAIALFRELKALGLGSDFSVYQEYDEVAGKKWLGHSSSKCNFALRFWTEYVGDVAFEEADENRIRDALERLPLIPKKHGKGTETWSLDHSFDHLIERADEEEKQDAAENIARLKEKPNATPADFEAAERDARQERLRADTIIKHRRLMASVGRMMVDLGLAGSNPFDVCAVSNRLEKQMKRAEPSRARTVWDDRLQQMFRTPVFLGGTAEVGDPLFWAPLMGRLMGLRQEEALQAAPEDFGTEQGLPYLDVKDSEGNHVKSEDGVRRVPVHPKLIELGLMDLVELRRREGQSRLFPNLKRGTTKGKFSENFTKTFTRYRQDNGVYWPGLDFHALRTTFNGDLMNQDKSDAVRCAIMGHEFKDEGGRSYRQGLGFLTLYERIKDVDVDTSMIVSPMRPAGFGASAKAAKAGLRVIG